MLHIKKVLNSSVILVVDDAGVEQILLGKGIGYGQKPGSEVPTRQSDQVFIPMTNPDAKGLLELIDSIPSEFFDLAREIAAEAESEFGEKLHPHVYVALTDHLNFAAERHQQGMVVTNRLFWEIKRYYPAEFRVGQHGLELCRQRLELDLPDEEAANIAFHLANSRRGAESADAMRGAQLIAAVMTIVTYTVNRPLPSESAHFYRFISHMQYFVDRFFDDRMLNSDEDFLYAKVAEKYPDATACADKIRTHVLTEYGRLLPNEEAAYLALHIQRLTSP